MKKLFMLLLSLIFFACSTEQTIDPNIHFFDIEETITDILEQKDSINVEKLIDVNGEKELVTIENYDLSLALNYLKEFNINKPRWYDKYVVRTSEEMTEYIASEDEMKIRNMKINYIDNQIEKIEISYLAETLISSMKKQIIFKPNSFLSINNKSESLIGKDRTLLIQWKW